MKRLIEVRAYQLQPGSRARFHAVMTQQSVPMLRDGGTDVVAHGPDASGEDAYVLIRAYDDLADRQARQDAFYGSPAWRQGPRESLVVHIVHYLNSLLWLPQEAVEALRTDGLAEALRP
jgi:NIPSNAP